MANSFSMEPIAHIRSDFAEKFGVPRQSGLVDALEASIVFTPPYRSPDALRGLEDFSHLWFLTGRFGRAGLPQSARPGWGEMPVWACSPPAHPSGPTPSRCPV